jgi:hypothetical protein
MINKSKTLVLGLAAMATLGLAGCGGNERRGLLWAGHRPHFAERFFYP